MAKSSARSTSTRKYQKPTLRRLLKRYLDLNKQRDELNAEVKRAAAHVAAFLCPLKIGQNFEANGDRYCVLAIRAAGMAGPRESWEGDYYIEAAKLRKDGQPYKHGGPWHFDSSAPVQPVLGDMRFATISSVDLLASTEVGTMKTLTRWHRRGLIPPPTIRLHPSGRGKMAYWPAWVVLRCQRITQLLRCGRSLDEIKSL